MSSDALQPSQSWGEPTTSDERLFALLAHVLTFVVPVLGALGVYLIKKDESRFVAYHATQAIVFQLITWIIGGVTCGFGLVLTLLAVWMALQANKGEWSGYPLIDGVGADR